MYNSESKLIKFIRINMSIFLLPIRMPLIGLYKLGQFADTLDELIYDSYYEFQYYIIDKLNKKE